MFFILKTSIEGAGFLYGAKRALFYILQQLPVALSLVPAIKGIYGYDGHTHVHTRKS